MFLKIGFLKNFAIFTGKAPVLESLLNKVASLQDCNFIKKRPQHRCFPVNIARFLRKAYIIEYLWQLLLIVFNPYLANVPFLLLLNMPKILSSSEVFRGFRNGTFVRNRLNIFVSQSFIIFSEKQYQKLQKRCFVCEEVKSSKAVVRRCSSKQVFLKIPKISQKKTPVLEYLFNKVADLKVCNFIKQRLLHRYFPAEFAKSLRTPFFTEHPQWLLLKVSIQKT